MAHQFGVTNVVSILGTAMTEPHVAMLRRFADRIVLLFDADAAGDTAVNRAVELFLTQPVEIAIASMPEGVDPDEYLLQHGAEAFEKVLADAADALTFKWKLLDRQFHATTDLTGRQKAVEEYLSTLSAAKGSGPVDSLRWGAALARVSRLADIPVEELNRRFKSKPPVRSGNRTSFNSGGAQVSRAGEPNNTVPPDAATAPVWPANRTARDRAERWILGILLVEPRRWHDVQQYVAVADFTDATRRTLAEVYWGHQRDEGEPVFNEFLGSLGDPALTQLAVELVDEVEALSATPSAADETPVLDRMLADAVAHLQELGRRREEQKLVAELRRTSDAPLTEHDEVLLLRKLQDTARTPDLRRAGI
jgi:DNA primase